jgi:hypothetical protein
VKRLAGLLIGVGAFTVLGVKAPVAAQEGRGHQAALANQGGVASPTPLPAGSLPCVGDCNGDSTVSVAELIVGVGMGLGQDGVERCPAFDFFADGTVTIDELLLSVAASNEGCGPAATPTPTATPGIVTLADIQDMIFTPRCAVVSCHSASPFPTADLNLEAGESFAAIVGQTPVNPAAESLGLLRVDPGKPQNSFLLVKVEGPDSPDLGARMPVFPPNLTPNETQLIRDWIAAGANP